MAQHLDNKGKCVLDGEVWPCEQHRRESARAHVEAQEMSAMLTHNQRVIMLSLNEWNAILHAVNLAHTGAWVGPDEYQDADRAAEKIRDQLKPYNYA